MAAMYRVTFDDGASLIIHAADAKDTTRRAVIVALRNARKRAEVRRRKANPNARAIEVRAVG